MAIQVRQINKQTAKLVCEKKHYSGRLGIFWEGFGLYEDDVLRGVCIYGQPSAPIQKHAFKHRDFRLYELTRLVVDSDVVNGASLLIGRSLRMLSEQPSACISYADSAHGHSGIVYQATNWLYTGATVSHDSMYLVDGVATHPMTLRDKLGINDPARWAKENGIEKIKPKQKHRYFYFNGTKYQKREMISKLNYPIIQQYPKSEKTMYASDQMCNECIPSFSDIFNVIP